MDLELRRQTWEALNVQVVHEFERMEGTCVNCGIHYGWIEDSPKCPGRPIESNNGIALDELVKFCNKHHYRWILECADQNIIRCALKPSTLPQVIVKGVIPPAEAICRALIEAAKAVKG